MSKGCDAAAAAEFPFVQDLPKREKTRRMKLMEVLEALEARTKEKGPVIPQSLAAEILGVSRARVSQLVDEGRMDSFLLNGSRFIFARSFQEFCKEDRPTGRPPKLGKIELLKKVAKNANHMGEAIADAMEGK